MRVATATVTCDCGTTHHVAVTLDEQVLGAAVDLAVRRQGARAPANATRRPSKEAT